MVAGKRIVVTCLVLGCLIPCALLIGQELLLRTNPERVSEFRALWYYVWPTAVFLMAAAGATPMGELLILGIALVGNILVYGLSGRSWRSAGGLCAVLEGGPPDDEVDVYVAG
jgi:hypothetical protein